MAAWTAEALARNVTRITFDDIRKGWDAWVLLRADAHHDSPHNDERKEIQHLEAAKELGAAVLDIGDLFDVMGGRFDPRKMESGVKGKHKVDNYFGAVLDDAAEFYSPYADNIVMLGAGNHETGVLKHHSINLTHALSRELKRAATREDTCMVGGYGGYVFLHCIIQGTVKHTIRIKYHHGHGGSSPVTKGVIGAQRRAVMFPDADIVVSGHIHNGWVTAHPQEHVTGQGVITSRSQIHISLPGYKDDWGDGHEGWAVEKGFGPNMTGACWLHLQYQNYKYGGDSNGKTPIAVTPIPLGWT